MFSILTAGALAQTWSYGHYIDDKCTVPITTVELDGKAGGGKTGLAIGACLDGKLGALEWSIKLKSCAADGNGRITGVDEYYGKGCSGTGGPRTDVTYTNGGCVKKDGSYHKLSVSGDCSAAPCFPSKATVMKADGTPIRVDALVEGDEIVATTEDGTP